MLDFRKQIKIGIVIKNNIVEMNLNVWNYKKK